MKIVIVKIVKNAVRLLNVNRNVLLMFAKNVQRVDVKIALNAVNAKPVNKNVKHPMIIYVLNVKQIIVLIVPIV